MTVQGDGAGESTLAGPVCVLGLAKKGGANILRNVEEVADQDAVAFFGVENVVRSKTEPAVVADKVVNFDTHARKFGQ